MPAKLETVTQSGLPTAIPLPTAPAVPSKPAGKTNGNGHANGNGNGNGHAHAAKDGAAVREAFLREAKRRTREEALARWKSIEEAGSKDEWVRKELAAKNLLQDHVDPARLNDKQKAHFKETKRAEAEARRGLERLAWESWKATHIGHLGAGVHWEENNDPDRFDIEGLDEKARRIGLPEMRTAGDVAKLLGMTISQLRWFTFHREVDSGTHYRRWQIPKRNGTTRVITAPKRTLKAAQRWALRNVFEKLPVHGAAHGFLPGRSIVSNAAVHTGADVLVKLDVKDFFPTINWRRVKGLLRKNGLHEAPATLLALLVTEPPRELIEFRGKTLHVATGPRALPQGAPTSPAISNAVCLRLDRRLSGLASKLGFRYTRYADDLAFSWRDVEKHKMAPHLVAPTSPAPQPSAAKAGAKSKHTQRGGPAIGTLIKGVTVILAAEGFRIHEEKTRVLRTGQSQRLTGLVLNKDAKGQALAPRTPRETLRRLRAAIHNREKGKAGKADESLAQLRGMAAFVNMTDPKKGAAFLTRIAVLEAKAGVTARA